MKPVVIYPRGFVGYDIGLPVRKHETDIKDIVESFNYNRNIARRNRVVISNTGVENLFRSLVENSWGTKSFEYREQVLKAALGAFGTKSFIDWCRLQEESPYLTDLHRRFLNDTFEFIKTGKRSMVPNTWSAIVKPRITGAVDDATGYYYKEYFRLNQASLLRRPFGVSDTIVAWTGQPGGFEDMIATLHILFGDLPS